MARKLRIDRIWWRNVQPGEFYNIERHHQLRGGGGSLYIEIPKSMVQATLDFLDVASTDVDTLPVITIRAGVVGDPDVQGEIEFQRKEGRRMRIARQNRQQPNSIRHPAWTTGRGFPSAPDDVSSTQEALPYYPFGGLRIYIAKTIDGEYFAGHRTGHRPAGMNPNDPTWAMYDQGVPGGVIPADWDA